MPARFLARFLALAVFISLAMSCGLPAPARAAENGSAQESEYYEIESLADVLPSHDELPDLSTPRATLMTFITASREGNFERAAHTLNFQAIPDKKPVSGILAMELYYVIKQWVDIHFKEIPDRRNGALPEAASDESQKQSIADHPRRSIKIGEIPLSLADVEIRLERFKPTDGEAVWLFSPRTTEKIEELYDRHGPGPLFDHLPFAARQGLITGSTQWQWLVLFGIGVLAAVIGWLCQRLAGMLSRRLATATVWEDGMRRLASPVGTLVAFVAFYLVTYVLLAPPGDEVRAIYLLVTILIVGGLTWVGIRLIDLFSALAARKYHVEVGTYAEEEARVRYTRISVGRHVLIFLSICVGLGLALYNLQVIKNLSLSFLASAGVASVILGATAHTVLGNTLAGVQIAITRPVAIGDSVNFEGNWGFVEDLTYAYITIRTWDGRRVIVPVSYFVAHPFENWSKSETRMMKPIYLYADYHVEVEAVRKKFQELLEQSDKWDRTVEPVLQVTGMSEKTIELRALCSANDPGTAWNLHCELRESLVRFLQTLDGGRYLPKHRVEVFGRDGSAGAVNHHVPTSSDARDLQAG
jgi:small-conductance mechanosensitive channel